jgi:hypothetical protein
MEKETRWGSFQDFLTWRDWMKAFVWGFVTILAFFAFAAGRTFIDFVTFLVIAAFAVRSFLAFRRKVRILTDLVEPNGA